MDIDILFRVNTNTMRVSSIGKGLRQVPSPRSHLCEHISMHDDKFITCRQRIYVTCPHCQKSLCLYHINEHQMLIRSLLDSLVNHLNEYRYELTVTLVIPPSSQVLVDNCLDEFKNVIIPYVQRTCCQNDVKQDDINRIQIFIDKMFTIIQHIHYYWDNDKKQKRSHNACVRIKKFLFRRIELRLKIDLYKYIVKKYSKAIYEIWNHKNMSGNSTFQKIVFLLHVHNEETFVK